MKSESVENPAMNAAGGAGIQAAQFVVEREVQAVVTGNMGPNACNVFQSADVAIYLFGGGTVQEAVEAYKAGELQSIVDANVQAHAGMGMGGGRGRGMGMGRGMGRLSGGGSPQTPPTDTDRSREDEIASLRNTAGELRKQLADVIERLDRLEKEE
jgi:predicted Fe-Mo cluster-binding NifX family protein